MHHRLPPSRHQMEIVIESPLRDSEARRLVGGRPGVVLVGNNPVGGKSSSSLLPPPPPPPEYFASLSNQRLLASGSSSDGLSGTPVRRVDRSGLLEMPLRDPGIIQTPRRVDRSGLLESVTEIPDHFTHDKSRFEGTTKTTNTTNTMSLTLPRVRCRDRRASNNEPKEAPASLIIDDIKRLSPNLNSFMGGDKIINDKSKENLRIFNNSLRNRETSSTTTTTATAADGLSIPDVIEAHEIPNGNSRDDNYDNDNDNDNHPPEGERVEAEGCEHTAIESIEEARVAFNKGAKKIMNKENKDGIQTLRVIILSEQL